MPGGGRGGGTLASSHDDDRGESVVRGLSISGSCHLHTIHFFTATSLDSLRKKGPLIRLPANKDSDLFIDLQPQRGPRSVLDLERSLT